MTITIRPEGPGDDTAISDVIVRAYADVPYSDRTEQVMVDRLRSSAAFVPELSLVAQANSGIVGHVVLTRIAIRNRGESVPSLALAPLSLVPRYQRRGVGASLVIAAHDRATELGFLSIIVVGIPGYYCRFGYEPLQRYGITIPFDVPDDQGMVKLLSPSAATAIRGMVQYPREWMER